MNTLDSVDRSQYETSPPENDPLFTPVTSNLSESVSFKGILRRSRPISTKRMMNKAITTLSTTSRKGFSLAGIRKYVSQNFLHTSDEVNHRMPFIKKFLKHALETGVVVTVKGTGLTGSFRVPYTSSLHKNAKQNQRKVKKRSTKIVKKTVRRDNFAIGPVLRPKKIKKENIIFSDSLELNTI